MRSRFLIPLLFVSALGAGAAAAQRQPPPGLQPLPEPPPMPAGPYENVQVEKVTTHRQDGDTIEETRVGGRVVMIRVTPAHGVPYVLTDPKGDGSFTQRRDSPEVPLSVPMWVLFTF
jgi:hypothetical protein